MTIKEFVHEKEKARTFYNQYKTLYVFFKGNDEFAKAKMDYYYHLYQKYCMFEENVLRNSLEGIDKTFFE